MQSKRIRWHGLRKVVGSYMAPSSLAIIFTLSDKLAVNEDAICFLQEEMHHAFILNLETNYLNYLLVDSITFCVLHILMLIIIPYLLNMCCFGPLHSRWLKSCTWETHLYLLFYFWYPKKNLVYNRYIIVICLLLPKCRKND
jgi:hypothetical protein